MQEKIVGYEMKCPYCGTIFEVDVNVVGLPPFDVECEFCGERVGSEFISATYYEDIK